MVRSFVAVIVGFFTIVLLFLAGDALLRYVIIPRAFSDTGRTESVPLLLFMLLYVFAVGLLGCWLAARIAQRKAMKYALILGVVVLFFGLLGAITLWETAPPWYHILSVLLIMPAAWVGGTLGQRQLARGAAPLVSLPN
jgi:hypothetical protein